MKYSFINSISYQEYGKEAI